MKKGLYYREGGNPPHIPALVLDGEVIAWWPAALKVPDQTQASLVLLAYEDKGSALTRQEVRALLTQEVAHDQDT